LARKSDIRLRRSAVSGSVPGGADLNLGELALNTADGAIFVKNGGGDIVTVSHDGILHYDEANSRIGIGTTNPSSTFQVEGTGDYLANFKSSDAASGIKLTDSSSQSRFVNISGHLVLLADANNNSSNSTIRFNIDTASVGATDSSMILTSTGLGIGTASPAFKLSVNSGTSDYPAHFESTDNKAAIIIADDDTTIYVSAESNRASLGMQPGLHVNNLNVMNTGYVGIGTSSPARRLTVEGASGDNLPARFIGGANTTHGSIEFQDPTTTADYKVVIGSKSDDLYFQSGGNEKARLTSGGFLGIGTGSLADTPIHVYRASGITGIIPQLKLHANTSDDTGTQGSSIDFVASSDKTAVGSRIIAARVAAGAHQNLKFHTARDTFAMIIDENQNVGIGVADPGAKLQVDGAIVSEGGSFASAQEGSITDVGLVIPKNNYIYSDDGSYLRKVIGHTSTGLIEIGQGGTALITDIILKPGSTGNVRFFASGSEDVRINSLGNMGVGTTIPLGNFVVSNSEAEGIEFFPGNFTNGNVIQNYNRATNAYVSLKQTAADYRFNIGTAEKVRIDTLGRLLVTDNGYNAQFSANIGGNSDKFVAVSSATAGETVAYHLGVNDTARNSRVKLFMTDDAATANRAFGIAQSWSSGGAMPFILTMGSNERLKVSTTGTVTFNNAYTFPASIGAAGQILKVPATGTDLIWGADAGGGSATLLTDSDGDTLIQVEKSTDEDIIRFDTAGQQRMTILSNGKVGIGNTATTILHVEDDNANSFGTTTAWEVQTSDSLALVNSSNSDADQITSFYMRASGNGGNASARQILRNTASGSGEIHWQMRDAAHTTTTNDKMILKSSGQLGIGISPSGAKLHIQDDSGVQLRVQSSVSTGDFYKSGNDLVIANNANGVVKFWNNSAERIRLDGSGHVRIGGAAAANASGSRQTLHIDSTSNGAAIRLSQNDSGALFRYDTTNGLKVGTITNEILTLQTNDTDAVQINTTQDVTIFGNELNIQGASPYIRGYGTGAMRIKHTAGQTMHIRPDENGQVSFYEGSSGNHVYLMTASPSTNSSTNDSSYLSFQTRSKKADGTSQSATASIRARTLNVSNNQSELLFTGMSQHRFANDVVVEGNLTVNGTQTVLNTSTLSVDDLNITVADGAADAAAANGAGLTVDGANATWTYSSGDDAWASNKHAQFYTGGGTGTLSVGRTSNQAIRLYADDNYNRIFAYQDSDTNGNHYFDLVRSFQGTGRADFRILNGSSVHMLVDKSGNVGIGTSTPSSRLNVVHSSNATNGIIVQNATAGTAARSVIRLLSDAAQFDMYVTSSTYSGVASWSDSGVLSTSSNASGGLVLNAQAGGIKFQDATTEIMRISDGGNVGIGTNAPTRKLQVEGTGNTAIAITSPNTAYVQLALGDTDDDNYAQIILDNSSNKLQIQNGGGGVVGDRGITLDSSENVGIGTASPASGVKLHVQGWTRIVGGLQLSATNAQVTNIANSSLLFGTNNTEKMRITADGDVGIGTSSPARKLDVNAGSASMVAQFKSTLTSSFVCFANSSSTADQVRLGSNGTALTFSTNYAERMRIDTSGNVGIGTSNPATKLQISNNGGHTSGNVTISHSSFDLYNPLEANTNEKGSIMTFSDNYYDGTNYIRTTRAGIKGGTDTVGNTADGFLAFYTDSGGANSLIERMRIDKDGFVGIGDTTPEVHLDVRGTGDTWTKVNSGSNTAIVGIRLGTATNSRENVLYRNKSNNLLTLRSGIDNAELNFIVGGSSQEAMRINGSGNVGIGTNNPSNLLHIHATGNNSAALIVEDDARRLEMGRDMIQAKSSNGSTVQNLYIQPAGITSFASNSGAVAIGNTGTLNGAKLYVKNGSSSQTYSNMSGILIDVNGTSNSYYGLRVGSSSGNNHLTVTNAGNVGIGTASVDAKLKVNQDAVAVGLKVTGGNSGSNIAEFVRDVGGTTTVSVSGYSSNPQMHFASTGNTFAVGVRSNSFNIADHSYIDGTNIRLAIDNTGRVGIGVDAPLAKLQVEEYGIDTTTSSTTATTQVAIHTFPIANFRSARFTIQITNTTDSTYHSTEILAIHDGTTANITEFGEVHTGSSVEATFDADVSSGNFRLLATPTSTNSMAFKVVCHSLTV